MMSKNADGQLIPYSFGHKWKDGRSVAQGALTFTRKFDEVCFSLRTDIPLKALNLHFGVTFSIVSQVNPHINAFFYASKGTVGRPVTHRRGRGWRGGYLGSATETYLKLELLKFLKVIRVSYPFPSFPYLSRSFQEEQRWPDSFRCMSNEQHS